MLTVLDYWQFNLYSVLSQYYIRLQRWIQKISRPCEISKISRFLIIFLDYERHLKFLPCEFTIFILYKSASGLTLLSQRPTKGFLIHFVDVSLSVLKKRLERFFRSILATAWSRKFSNTVTLTIIVQTHTQQNC